MDKEHQIEELASDIEKSLERAKSVVGSMNKGIGYWIAEDLVDKNYRKIIPNVDFVVRAGELSTIQMNARKQTAKKILQMLSEEWHNNYYNLTPTESVVLSMLIGRVCTKYGVEVEE